MSHPFLVLSSEGLLVSTAATEAVAEANIAWIHKRKDPTLEYTIIEILGTIDNGEFGEL